MPDAELKLKISKQEFINMLFKKKMNITKFCNKFDITRQTVHRVIKNEPISWKTAETICDGLSVDMIDLFVPYFEAEEEK